MIKKSFRAYNTSDLEKRIQLHNSGRGAKYLKGKGPVTLVYKREFRYYMRALRVEREIKQLTRAQKENLVKRNGAGKK